LERSRNGGRGNDHALGDQDSDEHDQEGDRRPTEVEMSGVELPTASKDARDDQDLCDQQREGDRGSGS
jgi:hypothetical protein